MSFGRRNGRGGRFIALQRGAFEYPEVAQRLAELGLDAVPEPLPPADDARLMNRVRPHLMRGWPAPVTRAIQ